MDTQIEQLLCKHCHPVVMAALDLERAQQAAKLARDRLIALGVTTFGSAVSAPTKTPTKTISSATPDKTPARKPSSVAAVGAAPAAPDPFKGRRNSRWRDVPIDQVLRNIRGDVSPNDLCEKLGIATSVLRSRVHDIIGQPDDGKRWQKGIGYVIKGKPAWDHEQGTLRVDKTKGAAMAAFTAANGNKSSSPSPKLAGKSVNGSKKKQVGPTDDELRLYVAGKISAEKLARKHKCANSTVYRAINAYKVRYGADAEHGEPKAVSATSNGSNGVKPHALPDGVLDIGRIVGAN